MSWRRVTRAALACSLGTLLSCDQSIPVVNPDPPPGPRATDAALTIEDVSITHGEIEALVEYFRSTDPRMGRNKCIRALLDQFLIPLAFVARDKAPELKTQRQRAQALVEALGEAGYDELVDKARLIPGLQVQKGMIRQHVTIPEQQWLFDDIRVGQMSPVLASPVGYSVVAAKAKHIGHTTASDSADIVIVPFHIFTPKEFDLWYADLKLRLEQLPPSAFRFHQDLSDALPPWIPRS